MGTTLSITPRAGYPAEQVEATESQYVDGWLLYHYKDPYNNYEIFTYRQAEGGPQQHRVLVSEPRTTYWGDIQFARVQPELRSGMPTKEIRVMTELLHMACDFADEVNKDLEAKAEAARKEREERERKEREERERRQREERERRAALEKPIRDWRAAVQETLQWHIGGWIRGLRWGMRATVFGTLDHVELNETGYGGQQGYIELTTEKGKYMRLSFEELEVVHLRDDDERGYTDLPLPDHPEYDSPVRRERREIAGGMGASRKDNLVTGE